MQDLEQHHLLIGVGSPHGDDQAGWRLVDWLARHRSGELEMLQIAMRTVSDPVDFLPHLQGVDRLVIADACLTGAPPGTIHRGRWPQLTSADQRAHSTHHVSLVQALQLGEALQRLPPEVIIYGIEIHASSPADDLSQPVEKALPELGRQILAEFQTT